MLRVVDPPGDPGDPGARGVTRAVCVKPAAAAATATRAVPSDLPDSGCCCSPPARTPAGLSRPWRNGWPLARVGRLDEAVEAVRPALDGADCGCLLYGFLDVLVTGGGAAAALDLPAATAERNPHVAEHAGNLRPWWLSEAGRGEEAIAEVVARIEKDDERYDIEQSAGLLDSEGRVEERSPRCGSMPPKPASAARTWRAC
ncbi:hypothetical protein [Embleya sp. MST-111070]|uniref:hypothetical protein n=1 Tax=Embleya sp. MST-111070 TaxID=3398231 RepID=UPI003F73F635